jgi:hypothetical protein
MRDSVYKSDVGIPKSLTGFWRSHESRWFGKAFCNKEPHKADVLVAVHNDIEWRPQETITVSNVFSYRDYSGSMMSIRIWTRLTVPGFVNKPKVESVPVNHHWYLALQSYRSLQNLIMAVLEGIVGIMQLQPVGRIATSFITMPELGSRIRVLLAQDHKDCMTAL